MGAMKSLYTHRMFGTVPPDPRPTVADRPQATPVTAPEPAPATDDEPPTTALPARRFGATRERLDHCHETGEPIADDSAQYTVDRRFAREDGSADYWLRDRWGGRLLIRCEAPRVVEPQPDEPPITRTETGAAAAFLDDLLRSAHAAGRTVRLGDDLAEAEVEGDSRPQGGPASWFLRRKADGRRLIVRLQLDGTPPSAAPLPPPPIRSDTPSPTPRKRRRGPTRDDQPVFGFLADEPIATGPYGR